MKILLKNAYVVDSNWQGFKDIVIENEKIILIENHIDENLYKFNKIYDLRGKLIIPGGIDPHTHMDLQQSETYRSIDDFYSGTIAAAVGGTTTIIDHIAFAKKNSSLYTSINHYHNLAKNSVIDYSFHGVIQHVNDKILQELNQIVMYEGITSFKAYSTYKYPMSDLDFFQLFKQLKSSGGLLTVHCENDDITNYLTNQLKISGEAIIKNYPNSRPPETESESVSRVIELAKLANDSPLYIVHVSASNSIEKIRLAKSTGQLNLFAETCPQYLVLDESKYHNIDGLKYLMAPPLRSKKHQSILWEALKDNTIDTLATDHCSFSYKEDKINGNLDFTKAPGGVPGVEERMLILFSEGVMTQKINLQQYVQLTSTNSAKIFGLFPNKGSLQIGTDADIVVIDPKKKTILSKESQKSHCDYNIYEGLELQGAIELVFLRGKKIVKNNKFLGNMGGGKFIKRDKYKLYK